MDRPCGDMVKNVLFTTFGPVLANSLWSWITTGAIAPPVAAAGAAVVTALALVGWYIAISISLNSTSRGVCLQGNWPLPPWIPMAVWAKGW
jgi:hypothetical protein